MKEIKFSSIKQDLNTLLGTYRGKREQNHLKAMYPFFMKNLEAVQWATWFPHALPFLGIPSAFCLVGYKLLGHTNKARVQPIKGLLNLVYYMEYTEKNCEPSDAVYQQRVSLANQDLLKRMQEIRAYPSQSSEYIKLNEICDKLSEYLIAAQFKKDSVKVMDSKDSGDIVYSYLG